MPLAEPPPPTAPVRSAPAATPLREATAGQWAQLLLGLALYGVAVALMIRSTLGLGPWDLFHQGLARIAGVSVGVASQLVGVALLVVLWRARTRFGAGTLLNIVLIGLFLDGFLAVVPEAAGPAMAWAYHVAGVALCGLATGAYIGARLGAGPRDSLMLTLAARTGRSVRAVRTVIELAVLAAGWAMGGVAGVGTLVFAFGIGPATQFGLRLFRVRPAEPAPPGAEA